MQLTLPHNGYKVPQKVAVVQRFKEESMYGLSTPKKWPYVEKPAQQTSYYTKVGGRVKKIERGGGREKLIQKIFPAKPVSRSRKILSFCFRSIVFFFFIHVAFLQREAAWVVYYITSITYSAAKERLFLLQQLISHVISLSQDRSRFYLPILQLNRKRLFEN